MKKRLFILLFMSMMMQAVLTGCGQTPNVPQEEAKRGDGSVITLGEEMRQIDDGLSAIRYDGDYGFDGFFAQGGASSDNEVAAYLTEQLRSQLPSLAFGGKPFGCSTISVKNEDGEGYLFGRNFDWNKCNAMVVSSRPEQGYASVSTVNTDFIEIGGIELASIPDSVQAVIAMYAPLDGMNERGLSVSVNMIEDAETIEQVTDKPDITTTTAIRLLLDRAANVEEALNLLKQHDLHASMGMMVHFAIADADGRSVAVEYVNNEMVVTETPVVTNFYLARGEKYGIGSAQSHTRYDLLQENLQENKTMNQEDVRDALDRVSKDNFDEFESTEWSIVMDQNTKELTYYHRENYQRGYTFLVK